MHKINTKKSLVVKTLCWIFSLLFVYFSVCLFYFLGREGWDLDEIAFQIGMTLISFGALIYTASPKRFAWGGRLISFVIFIGFFVYFFDQFVIQQKSFNVTVSRSISSPFNALLGLLIIGIPCLMYSLWGRFWWAQMKKDEIERNARFYYIALAVQSIFLMLSIFSIVYYFLN